MVDDFFCSMVLFGHFIGSPLRHAYTVAETAAGKGDGIVIDADIVDKRAFQLGRADVQAERRRGDFLAVDEEVYAAAGFALFANFEAFDGVQLKAGIGAGLKDFVL